MDIAYKSIMKILSEIRRIKMPRTVNDCFIPEKDNPYPLCIGRELEECENCQLRADWEPEDPYGVE